MNAQPADYGRYLSKAARAHPDRVAVRTPTDARTFAEWDERSDRVASAVAGLGLEVGDRVADLGGNRLASLELDFGLARGGFVRVPIVESASFDAKLQMVQDAEASALFVGHEYEEEAADLARRTPSIEHIVVEGSSVPATGRAVHGYDDLLSLAPAWDGEVPSGRDLLSLRYTGGTTGPPKGVMRTHLEQIAVATCILLDLYAFEERDVVLHATPLSHGANPYVLPAVMRGAQQVVMPRWDADQALELIETHGCTVTKVVPPTMINELVAARSSPTGRARGLGSLRTIIYGSAPLPEPVLARAEQVFGKIFAQTYAQTEMPLGIATLSMEEHEAWRRVGRPGGIRPTGRPYTLCDVRIRPFEGGRATTAAGEEVGEVLVHSPVAVRGYWRREGATAAIREGDWIRTGDAGLIDPHGYVRICGRKQDAIETPGGIVFPIEVEEALYRHPAVREAAVVADGRPGESDRQLMAVVALDESASEAPTEAALREFCADQLDDSRVPTRILVVGDLPKSPTGKILRREALQAASAIVDEPLEGRRDWGLSPEPVQVPSSSGCGLAPP